MHLTIAWLRISSTIVSTTSTSSSTTAAVRNEQDAGTKPESSKSFKDAVIEGQTGIVEKLDSEKNMTWAEVVQGKKIGVKEDENKLILLKQSKL